MTQCSNCDQELEEGAPVTLEQDGYNGPRRVGTFCDFSCVSDFIDDEGLLDADLKPPRF